MSSNPRTATEAVVPHLPAATRKHSTGDRGAWSKARLSAAVSATRSGRAAPRGRQPLGDEVEFFDAVGIRQDVRSGTALARRETVVREVHLVERGALAVIGDHAGRSPILAFALRRELCCAIPALLHETAPWDAVAVMNSSVITVPADAFIAEVRDRWADRWATRALTWLAEVGTCAEDLDQPDPKGQVAALLLRSRGIHSEEVCRRTIADLLDLDDVTTFNILSDLERLGAVRSAGGYISVARPELLRAAITAVGLPPRHNTSRAKNDRLHAPRAVAAG